jgi:hypothetical protein
MSVLPDQEYVAAALAALALPAAPDIVSGVGAHFARLSDLSKLVMDVVLPDETEAASTFEP